MAEADHMSTNIEVEGAEKNLKYLEFVQIAALHSVFCLAKIYGYAKDNSGPMKPGVLTVEGTVKKVVGPVYEKFHDVPNDFLKFVDRKVDESVTTVESHVSPRLKQASTQAFSAAQKAPAAALSVASDVKNAGVIGTASGLAKTVYVKYEPTAKELYSKYEPVAEKYAVSTWRSLNKLPLFPQVAQTVVPAAAYVSERYNQTVQQTAEKGFKVASYLPLVPTEKIAKVFNDDTVTLPVSGNPGGIATSEPVAAN